MCPYFFVSSICLLCTRPIENFFFLCLMHAMADCYCSKHKKISLLNILPSMEVALLINVTCVLKKPHPTQGCMCWMHLLNGCQHSEVNHFIWWALLQTGHTKRNQSTKLIQLYSIQRSLLMSDFPTWCIAFWYPTLTKCGHILNRFLNHKKIQSGSQPHTSDLFSYNCTQDTKVKKKSIKSNDATKHWDRPSMPTFSCQSLLKIRLQVIYFQVLYWWTMPIYKNSALGNSIADADGSIPASHDFVSMGRPDNISNGKWWSSVNPVASSGMPKPLHSPLEY